MKEFDEKMKELKDAQEKAEAERAQYEAERQKYNELKAAMEKQAEETDRMLQDLQDFKTWRELSTEMANVMNGVKDIKNKEFQQAIAKIENVRRYFNNGNEIEAGMDSFIAALSKSDLFNYFPKPTSNDKGYAKFYNTVNNMRSNSLLAHRFDLAGKAKQDGIEYTLHFGNQNVMVQEMASSFTRYVKSNGKDIVAALMEDPECRALGEEALSKVLNDVSHDVREVITATNADLVESYAQSDQLLLLAPSLKVNPMETHAISTVFWNDICLIGDKARNKNQGVEVFQLTGDAKTMALAKQKVASEIVQKRSTIKIDDPVTTIDQYTADLTKKLNMKKIGHIPLQAQFGENCTWSSCSKTILLNALYCRIYQAALKTNKDPKQAQQLAQRTSKLMQKDWAKDDKFDQLQSYIAQYTDPAKQHLGPDPVLLAYVKLKYQYRQGSDHILKLIDGTGLVKDEHVRQAKEMGYKRAETMLQEEYPSIYKFFPTRINEIARRFADLYMLTNKATIEKVFNSISFLSISPFQNAISALDEAIKKAQSATPSEKRARPLLAKAENASTEKAASSTSTVKEEIPRGMKSRKK